MAYTQDQIEALETAIAQGVLNVEYADKRVTYRSLDEMLKTLNLMKGVVDPVTYKKALRRYSQHSKGTD